MARYFNSPPGWPSQPKGWKPPLDWRPDPAWPAAPDGWEFWVEQGKHKQTKGGPARKFMGAFLVFGVLLIAALGHAVPSHRSDGGSTNLADSSAGGDPGLPLGAVPTSTGPTTSPYPVAGLPTARPTATGVATSEAAPTKTKTITKTVVVTVVVTPTPGSHGGGAVMTAPGGAPVSATTVAAPPPATTPAVTFSKIVIPNAHCADIRLGLVAVSKTGQRYQCTRYPNGTRNRWMLI
jgi:hypothetical protein